jgi:hypothetical protein
MMSDEKPQGSLDSLPISQLRARLMVLTKVIKQAQSEKDPRWEEAARQQRAVNVVLVKKIKEARARAGRAEPRPITIGMQAACMKSRAIRR